ncbi:hypothetical protein ABTG24_18145, partial [Acinetobacter baumannii]
SYPSCNLNFSNLGKLCRQRLYATKPTQNKRHQELMRIIQEAEKNLQTIERNPNRVSHSNLASYNLQKYISDKKIFF